MADNVGYNGKNSYANGIVWSPYIPMTTNYIMLSKKPKVPKVGYAYFDEKTENMMVYSGKDESLLKRSKIALINNDNKLSKKLKKEYDDYGWTQFPKSYEEIYTNFNRKINISNITP